MPQLQEKLDNIRGAVMMGTCHSYAHLTLKYHDVFQMTTNCVPTPCHPSIPYGAP